MKIQSIRIENFMAIKEATLTLADRGLVLIQGKNEDETSAESNGAGKSSIADAISWCLYGATARGEDSDGVVNSVAGKNCRVQVVVEDGDHIFTIIRHRKHKANKNALKVWQYDKDAYTPSALVPGTDLTKGTEKLTQEVVNRIIGCSYDVFCGAVYAGQERMPDLPGMTDKNLKMLIEEASGATLLEAAYKEASNRKTAADQKCRNAIDEVQKAQNAVEHWEKAAQEAEESSADFEKKRTEKTKALLVEAKAFSDQILKKKGELGLIDAKKIIEDDITSLDKAIAAVANEKKTESAITARLSTERAELSGLQTAVSYAERKVETARNELATLDHRVGCPCSTCSRPFTADDIDPAKKLAAEVLQKSEDAYAKARGSRDAKLLTIKNTESELKAYQASMTDLTAVNDRRQLATERLAKIVAIETEIGRLATEKNNRVAQAKGVKDETNPFNAIIEREKKRKEDAETALALRQKHQKTAVEELAIAEAVQKVFSPAGVRAFLLDEVTPFLNSQTAKYLGTLSDGHLQATWTTLVKNAKGELREKFSIEVTNTTGGKTFNSISGGEKRKVRIACALALQDLVARRATKPIELFIGDEIDDALDSAGLERLTTILEEKARERGSVFIISHNDLQCWIRNSITVKKVGGTATVEETTA